MQATLTGNTEGESMDMHYDDDYSKVKHGAFFVSSRVEYFQYAYVWLWARKTNKSNGLLQ